MSVNEKMTAIADNIREKTEGTEALTLDGMVSGVNEVYEAGKKAEYDFFWDSFQSNGTRKDYQNAFCYLGWNNAIFKPKYQIKPANAQAMFYRNTILSGKIEAIINIDWSNCTNFRQVCQDLNRVTHLGVLDLRKATDITNAFIYMGALETIDKVIVDESLPGNLSFSQDISLRNIIFEGVISKNINISYSPLSVESTKSIVTHLKDYAGTDNQYTNTVTFKASVFETLEASGEKPPSGNTWAEYIDNLKWNLTLS